MTVSDPPVRPSKRRVSYSQYSMWATCPHQWKLSHVDKLKPKDPSIHLIFGTAIHHAIQLWLNKHYTESATIANVFDMESVFKYKLIELFKEESLKDKDGTTIPLCDKSTLMEFYADGVAILRHVKKYKQDFFPTMGWKLVGCEIPLEVRLNDGVEYIGYLDIVLLNKAMKKVKIIDLKTSTRGWFHEKKDNKKTDQLLLYKDFYSSMFGVPSENIEIEFLILKRQISENSEWVQKRLARFEPSNGPKSMKQAVSRFEGFINEAFDSDGTVRIDNLKPTPSEKNCRWCPFKSNKELCPASFYKGK